MEKEQLQSPKEETQKVTKTKDQLKAEKMIKRLKDEGFHNCTKHQLEKDGANNIVKIGKTIGKIKAMHESNIDEFNGQQHNSGLFIKKEGKKYELIDVKVPGRSNHLKMIMEK